MNPQEIIRLCAKEGMGAVAIGAGIWLLWFMIKYTVMRLGGEIDKLVVHLTEFTTAVRKEHKDTADAQSEIILQHKEITEILKGINNRVK